MTSWLITGASRGLGRMLTEGALRRGDTVAATMRDPASFSLADDVGSDRVWVGALDVTDVDQVRTTTARVFAELGRIDVVVSNAGYGIYGAAEELTDDQVNRIVQTNLVGSIQVARAAVPFLRSQGGGRIIQISSMAGHFSRAGFSLYHATKWGLEGFFGAFAEEVAKFGISTTVLAPGRFPTSFYATAERPPALEEYRNEPNISRRPADAEEMPGDPAKLISLILDLADTADPPLRLLLGSDAYAAAHAALSERLISLEDQRDLAFSTNLSRPGTSPAGRPDIPTTEARQT